MGTGERRVTIAGVIRARLLRALGRNPAAPELEPSVFIRGDASGSVIENVETDADVFIEGDRSGAVFRNVVHRTKPR
jgi:hypothetical protein